MKHQISVSLPPEIIEALNALKTEKMTTRSLLVQAALEEFLSKQATNEVCNHAKTYKCNSA